MGTPNYMSPEQASSQPVTALTDVYSLGAVLYELLTGQKPFSASDFDKLLYNITHKTPKSPELINPNVPEKLAHIVMKALQKEPHRRYKSAAEMALALNKYLAGEKRARRQSAKGEISKSNGATVNWKEKGTLFWLGWGSFLIAGALAFLAFTSK